MKKLNAIFVAIAMQSFCAPKTHHQISLFNTNGHRHFSVEQRSLIAEVIEQHTSCRLLIIGTGLDSSLWTDINREGYTLFLEHDPFWIQKCKKEIPEINIMNIQYDTKITDWKHLINKEDYQKWMPQVNPNLFEMVFDVILIDGPPSYHTVLNTIPTIGRMQAFFLVAKLIKSIAKPVHIFVHDTDRSPEKKFAEKLFGISNLQMEINNLHYYLIP